MINRFRNNKGMLVLALAIGLVVIVILFATISNRMRAEALITNRVSINERLNQFASAIGRLSIRKLQRDIELRNQDDGGHGPKILQWIKEHPDQNEYTDDFTSVIKGTGVYKALIRDFSEKWGKQGSIDEDNFKVDYLVKCIPSEINPSQLDGVTANPYEKKGYIDLSITVAIPYGVKRKYTIRKEFIYARLLAAPFYRFTLFSPKGAEIVQANTFVCDNDGKNLDLNHRPMVCLNRRIAHNTQSSTNFVESPSNVVKNGDSFVKNGWIYLGGTPKYKDTNRDNRLMLNVSPGSDCDDLVSKFGEYFHFYYTKEDSGWLEVEDWRSLFDGLYPIEQSKNFQISDIDPIPPNWNPDTDGQPIRTNVVSYGLSNSLFNIKYANIDLFTKEKMKKIYDSMGGNANDLDYSSSMHLFGTPKRCTPTLVFGPVNRRYVKVYAIYFMNLGRVFPLPAVTSFDELASIFPNPALEYENEESMPLFVKWYIGKFSEAKKAIALGDALIIGGRLLDPLKTAPVDELDAYYNGFPNTYNDDAKLNGPCPHVYDTEPYVTALKLLSAPDSGDDAVLASNKFFNNPSELCNSDYEFNDEFKIKESMYKGKLSDIRIDYDNYLKDRTTYTLTPVEDGKPVIISYDDKCHPFIRDHFVLGDGEKKYVFLNQIIRINGDLEIDSSLHIGQGGIIVCDGKITINRPIYNKVIEEGVEPNDPNNFGYLTLVAKKGIVIKDLGFNKDELPPKVEAFLIAGLDTHGSDEEVYCEAPVRIIGGVAADKINSIVEKGCVVEWGMEPNESTDYMTSDFYGLTIGPRDIELYTAE